MGLNKFDFRRISQRNCWVAATSCFCSPISRVQGWGVVLHRGLRGLLQYSRRGPCGANPGAGRPLYSVHRSSRKIRCRRAPPDDSFNKGIDHGDRYSNIFFIRYLDKARQCSMGQSDTLRRRWRRRRWTGRAVNSAAGGGSGGGGGARTILEFAASALGSIVSVGVGAGGGGGAGGSDHEQRGCRRRRGRQQDIRNACDRYWR